MVLYINSVTSFVSGNSEGWGGGWGHGGGRNQVFFYGIETEFEGLQVTLVSTEWDYRDLKCLKGSQGYVSVLGLLWGLPVALGG